VTVATDPPGATVFVDEDGQDGMTAQQCTSPCQLSFGIGSRHTFRMTLAGYRERKYVLSGDRGSQPPLFKLVRKAGTLFISGPPTVLIDGTRYVTGKPIDVDEGVHEVSVETPGGIATQKVTVKDGDLQKIDVNPGK
jgi:hypothetical protein